MTTSEDPAISSSVTVDVLIKATVSINHTIMIINREGQKSTGQRATAGNFDC